ncbi:MAG: Mur ligase domain-containing protein, partial [Thermodesulfobacteriota bacterium]
MILGDLLRGIETKQILGPKHIEILGISYNSKEVRDGFLFVAVEGGKKDGHEYLKSAMENGARALLV